MSPSRPDDRRGPRSLQVAVVGAGAAGLLAAIFAARRGARVALFETKKRPGAKIRVSGGGRCNILPSRVEPDGDFHTSGSPTSLRNLLLSWPLAEVRAFFQDELGIPLKVEPGGKVFPASERPQDVVAALLGECERRGVTLICGARIVEVRRLEDAATPVFELRSLGGDVWRAERLVLATGGLSLPKSGSDGGGLEIARSLGLEVAPTYPVLVALESADPRWLELPGVSTRATLRAVQEGRILEEREGDFLFTHRGFSGPVVLDLSRHVTMPTPGGEGPGFRVRWGGNAAPRWLAFLRGGGRKQVAVELRRFLPRRLAAFLVALEGLEPEIRLCDLRKDDVRSLARRLEECPLPVARSEGFRTAEATGGGIPLSELRLKSLESRSVPGLHLSGEMLDVDGRIGGYNCLWAWVTGRRAGLGAGEGAAGPSGG
ncbi:MAG: aminoacetone oxidase family FAD-binding enzyme [Planctomycetota bacterium]|nr:aminoacetone oxidase family FAD-binding enzyme [Planctomycetota bacterium]